MPDHTPGPWKDHPFSSVVGVLIGFGDCTKGENVAAVFLQKNRVETIANGHLIAAAPELLDDAVERDRSDGWFIDQLRELSSEPLSDAQRGDRFSSIIAHIEAHRIGTRAVIAKAEGRQ